MWNVDELQHFLDHGRDHPEIALWWLPASTGMRLGEALALQWSAIDWERQAIAVRRTMSRDADWKLRPRDGTKGGDPRTLRVDTATLDALRPHRRRQRLAILRAASWADPTLGFPTRKGTDRSHGPSLLRFRQRAEQAGVPSIRLHDLSHTHATLLLVGDVHPKIVQERLGHKSLKTTLDRNSHVVPGMQDLAVAAIDALVNGPPGAVDRGVVALS